MNIFINGQPYNTADLTANTLLSALALFLTNDQQKQSFAVALNGDFIDKCDYSLTKIGSNDCIDVLFPIQGG
jgi:thiamine biosynthesis protein ThiS